MDSQDSARPLSFVELVALMTEPRADELTVHGRIRSFAGDDESRHRHGYFRTEGQPHPVFAGLGAVDERRADAPAMAVWRAGERVRIDRPDGRPSLIVGAETTWQFWGEDDVPVASPSDAVRYGAAGTQLLWRWDHQRFLGDDFTRPTGPVGATTFLGRPAWTVELAPPAHKPHPMQLVVDAETGLVLQQRNDGFGSVDEWVELVLGEPVDPALFTWDGPARSEADVRAEQDRRHHDDMAERAAWFAAHVTSRPLRLEIEPEVMVHERDDATGAFHASVHADLHGSLLRRQRSAEPWPQADGPQAVRWSDDRWDWALLAHGRPLGPDVVEALRRQLGSSD